MKPYYRKASITDALKVAANIREEDRQEIEGLGHSPLALVWCVETSAHATAFFNKDNEIIGIAGVGPDDRPGVGQVWMICTPQITKNPHTFVREAKRWLKRVGEDYDLLWNRVDARNKYHHKLLKLLGFKSLNYTIMAPHNLPYIEIVKCVSQQQQRAPQVQ